jgi:hypothetical protein
VHGAACPAVARCGGGALDTPLLPAICELLSPRLHESALLPPAATARDIQARADHEAALRIQRLQRGKTGRRAGEQQRLEAARQRAAAEAAAAAAAAAAEVAAAAEAAEAERVAAAAAAAEAAAAAAREVARQAALTQARAAQQARWEEFPPEEPLSADEKAEALCGAAQMGDEAAVHRLLRGPQQCNPAARNSQRYTALHLAAAVGSVGVTRLLLGGGADVHAQTPSGATALHTAVRANQASVAEVLLSEGGALLHATDGAGRAPLHIAAEFG